MMTRITKKIMNTSLEFVKKRLKEMGMNWDYEDEDVDIHSPESLFRRVLKNSTIIDLPSEDTLAIGYQLTLFNDEKIDVKVTIADDDFVSDDYESDGLEDDESDMTDDM